MNKQKLLHEHSIYRRMRSHYQSCMDSYLANNDFKRSTRLKRPNESAKSYDDLIKNTTLLPISRYIVDRINDTIFEPGQQRLLNFVGTGQQTQPEWAQLFCLDIDLAGNDIASFMSHANIMSSIFGHCWISVDRTDMESRPYAQLISPLQVIDWEFENYSGRRFLTKIKILETDTDDCQTYIIYRMGNQMEPTSWERWELEKGHMDKEPMLINEGQLPAGMTIPVIQLLARTDPRLGDIGISDIDSSVSAMREIYQLETESYLSIIYGKSILRVSPSIKTVPAFSGGIVQGQAGDIESIDISTTDVEIIRSRQDSILKNLLDLSGLSGMAINSNQVASGLSIIETRKTIHNIARTKARFLETAEEQIFSYAGKFMGQNFAGEIKYNNNYSNLDTTYRLSLMEKAIQLAPTDTEIQAMIATELKLLLAQVEPAPALYSSSYADIPVDMEEEDAETETESDDTVSESSREVETVVSMSPQRAVQLQLLTPRD